MESIWTTGKRFSKSTFDTRVITNTKSRDGRLVAREDERIGSTIPKSIFARRPLTVSSCVPVDIPQRSMVGQQRQQIPELQFGKFPTPSSILCWKIRFRNRVTLSFVIFPWKGCCGSQRWRWSTQWRNRSPRDELRARISRILICWTRRLLLL